MAVLDGEVYICGGHDGLSIFDSVSPFIICCSFVYFACVYIPYAYKCTSSSHYIPALIVSG